MRLCATLILVLVLAIAAKPVAAHEVATVAKSVGWNISAGLIVLVASIYGSGLWRLWRRAGFSRGINLLRVLVFAAGLTVLALLLLSPIDGLAERALSVHMVQHFGLMLVAAPLIVLGRPALVTFWALPAFVRHSLGDLSSRHLRFVWRATTHPASAWLIYLATLWIWHAPPLHQTALTNEWIHIVQHASFIIAALIFWTSILDVARPERHAAAVLAIFATAIHSCALAALLTTAQTIWYPAYGLGPRPFGFTPLGDQQLAGLVMWVPCCALLIGAALAAFARLLNDVEARSERSSF